MNHQHQIIPYLLQQDTPLPMITILEQQRISNEDLQTMDRDDIEHLFKNEYGFTFAERKRFWNTIQKLRPSYTKSDVVHLEQEDETPDIYEIVDDQPSNCSFISRHSSLLPSSSSIPVYDDSNKTMYENSNSNSTNIGNLRIITSSFPTDQSTTSTNVIFRYPVPLPLFSYKVMQALENNTIQNEWRTFIKELVFWILTKKSDLPTKSEYQAIGQTLFKQYPGIGKDGFRPWSYFCKCLTESLRKERYKRGLPRIQRLNSS